MKQDKHPGPQLKPLLSIRNLNISFPSPRGEIQALHHVSFSMGRQKLGIVGESGSGKSITGRSILKLLPASAKVSADSMEFDGIDLLQTREKAMRQIRGKRISMVMQDPKYSLNPVMRVGDQIAEAYLTHARVSQKEAKERSISMLEAVRIRNPKRVYSLYPNEVSGGMGQRIMIAMMLIPEPSLLIADEPTSALDVTVQLQVMAILDDLVMERGMGLILISHDLKLVASFCDQVIIMYGGRIMEICQASELYRSHHPYTRGLLNCLPDIKGTGKYLPILQREAAWLEDHHAAH
jgi:peptide/nickel transport system ATP-binding protein